MGKTCQICGKNSGIYPLCTEHLMMKADGKVVKCPDCSRWHLTNEPCQCQKSPIYTQLPTEGFNKCVSCGAPTKGYAFCKNCWSQYSVEEMLDILNNLSIENNDSEEETYEEETYIEIQNSESTVVNDNESNNVVIIDVNNNSKCITCGKRTDGLLFCTNCYHKYKRKDLLFRITNCTNIELLDEDYEGRYTCKDGHIVKSKSERDIDNYLFEHNISHAYERELPYGSTDKEVLHPDFYLPNYLGEGNHVYIEHWGYNENNIQYTKTKKFKMPIYERLGITLICTYEKTDMGRIDTVLDRKLNKSFINIGQINYEDKSPESTNKQYSNTTLDNLPF